MATTEFFIGVNNPAVGTVTVPLIVHFDLATQILPWLASTYGKVAETDENGEPVKDENNQPVMRDRTPLELLRCLADATGKGHAASVASFVHQQQVAAIEKPAVVVELGEATVEAPATT